MHFLNKPHSARLDDSVGQREIFVENKLFPEEKGATHRHIILTGSYSADPGYTKQALIC
jgi:hypothetical protein